MSAAAPERPAAPEQVHLHPVEERRPTRTDLRIVTAFTVAHSVTLTLASLGLVEDTPYLVFGYRSPALHLVLDSVDACIAFLVTARHANTSLPSTWTPGKPNPLARW